MGYRDDLRNIEDVLDEREDPTPPVADLEPASALAAIDVTPVDHPKTSGEVFAFQLLTESWIDETGQHDQKRMGQLIEADGAAVREAALREAIAVVGALDAEYFEHNRVAGELALRRAGSELAKLLAGKVTHG